MPGGRAVIKGVAERFPQLYLIPGENGAEQAYLDAVLRGISPPENGLLHFQTDERDRLETVFTPTGSVDVLTLHRRQDFELFLRIMAHRCGMGVIPPAQGAATLIGIPEWGKINAHKEAFLKEEKEKGNSAPDWGAEFRSFTADKKNYVDDPADEKKLNDLARRVSSVLKVFEKVIAENGAADVFALISILEARQKDLWGVG